MRFSRFACCGHPRASTKHDFKPAKSTDRLASEVHLGVFKRFVLLQQPGLARVPQHLGAVEVGLKLLEVLDILDGMLLDGCVVTDRALLFLLSTRACTTNKSGIDPQLVCRRHAIIASAPASTCQRCTCFPGVLERMRRLPTTLLSFQGARSSSRQWTVSIVTLTSSRMW